MDIKDFILLVGCLLIMAVIGHGLWIAWRTRNEALPFDIGEGPIDVGLEGRDPYEAELPNGGARPAHDPYGDYRPSAMPEQASLLPPEPESPTRRDRADAGGMAAGKAAALRQATKELLGKEAEPAPTSRDLFDSDDEPVDRVLPESLGDDATTRAASEMGLVEVEFPAETDPLMTERRGAAADEPVEHFEEAAPASEPVSRTPHAPPPANDTLEEQPSVDDGPDDLVVIQLLAPEGETFAGNVLCASLRQHGLRYGDKSLFHRVRDGHEGPLFSVVNVIKPGFFDLGQLDSFSTPGIAFFMTLPGPAEPVKAFDDMVRVARRLAGALNGRLVDDAGNLFSAQTQSLLREHVASYRLKHYNRQAL